MADNIYRVRFEALQLDHEPAMYIGVWHSSDDSAHGHAMQGEQVRVFRAADQAENAALQHASSQGLLGFTVPGSPEFVSLQVEQLDPPRYVGFWNTAGGCGHAMNNNLVALFDTEDAATTAARNAHHNR